MGQYFPKPSNNIPASDTTNIILSKIYNSSCKISSLRALIRNLNGVVLMDLKAILLKELLHNPKLNSRKFNRYAALLSEIDLTIKNLNKETYENKVMRMPSEETRPARQVSVVQSASAPAPAPTANYNLTLCHSSSTDEPIRRSSSINSAFYPTLPPPPPVPCTNLPPSAPPHYDDK